MINQALYGLLSLTGSLVNPSDAQIIIIPSSLEVQAKILVLHLLHKNDSAFHNVVDLDIFLTNYNFKILTSNIYDFYKKIKKNVSIVCFFKAVVKETMQLESLEVRPLELMNFRGWHD